MKNMILASSSSIYGSSYLEYLRPALKELYKNVSTVLFIPYASPSGISDGEYTVIAQKGLYHLGVNVIGIHQFPNAKKAIENAEAIFVGGGNTFVLVDKLYKNDCMEVLKNAILSGTPYLGTSAGSNICGINMQTTNDMPIVMPQSFETLGMIPFNINAHYIVANPNSKHKGETRETRIKEFHLYNEIPVIGLQEGSWLQVHSDQIVLKGILDAYLFKKDEKIAICLPQTEF